MVISYTLSFHCQAAELVPGHRFYSFLRFLVGLDVAAPNVFSNMINEIMVNRMMTGYAK